MALACFGVAQSCNVEEFNKFKQDVCDCIIIVFRYVGESNPAQIATPSGRPKCHTMPYQRFRVFSHMRSKKHQCVAVFADKKSANTKESTCRPAQLYVAQRHEVYFKGFVPYRYVACVWKTHETHQSSQRLVTTGCLVYVGFLIH